MIGLMIGNIRHWPAKTFEWRGVTQDLRKGGPIEMLTTCTIAKLIKIKVLWHQFSITLYVPFKPNLASKIFKSVS